MHYPVCMYPRRPKKKSKSNPTDAGHQGKTMLCWHINPWTMLSVIEVRVIRAKHYARHKSKNNIIKKSCYLRCLTKYIFHINK